MTRLLIFLAIWNFSFGVVNAIYGIILWDPTWTSLGAANLAVAYFVMTGLWQDRSR